MKSNLSDRDLENLLKRHFGRDGFALSVQKEIVTSILSGRDVLAVTHRGFDQSVCYKLPALVLDGLTLVVSRAGQIVEREGIDLLPATHINSSLPTEHLQKRIWDMAEGKYRLIYVGPELFRNRSFLFAITTIPVSLLAVEDAHCISRWGYDFRPDYLDIGRAVVEMNSQACVLALAGASTQRTRDDILHQLQIDDAKRFTLDLARPDLSLEVISAFSPEEKFDALRSLVRKLGGRGIVYANLRHQTVEICDFLKEFEPKVAFYHAGLKREKRVEVERAFTTDQLRIVVATTAGSFGASSVLPFGEGEQPPHFPFEKRDGDISKPSDRSRIKYVIHFDMPDRPERYYEQISIAGGDEQPARCILIYSPSDRGFHHNVIERNTLSPAEVWRISEVLERDVNVKRETSNIEHPLVVLPYGQMELETAMDRYKLGNALREMENAGMLSVLPDCSMQARARILVPRDKLAAYAEDETGESVVEWLLENSEPVLERSEGSDTGEEVYIDFARLKTELSCPHDVLEDCLLALHYAEAISYRSSRRGMALRLIDLDASLADDAFEKLKESRYQALRAMEEYVHTRECRQVLLCGYLGDEMGENCGNCDNCVSAMTTDSVVMARHTVPLPHYARVAMELVNRSEGRLSKDALVKILAGLAQRTTRFDRWKEFGALSIFAPEDILRMLDLLIGHGFLKEEGEAHPPVDLTRKGFRALEGELELDDAGSIASLAEDIGRIAQVPASSGEQEADSELNRALIIILRCAERTDGQVGRWGLAKILQGQKSKRLAKYGFDHIEEYGSLPDMPRKVLLEYIDAMIERGCLAVTSFFFPMLRLTEVGQKRLDRMQRHS
jgi:superfamily II DNA helicase RecQ